MGNSTPADASTQELDQFVLWRITMYKEFNKQGADLSELYAINFEQFTADDFQNIGINVATRLRDFLRANGVYTRKGRGTRIAKELYAVMKDELPWLNNDPERPIAANSTTISIV